MKFQIKQHIFSFGDTFTILDEHQKEHYQVEGKVFSFGKKLKLYDMQGTELYYIEQKLFKLLAEYTLHKQGQLIATCKKKFSLLGSKFEITSSLGDFEIIGSPLNYNFQITKNGQIIAYIDKQYFSFSDTYGVDILDTKNYAFILSLVIIIDQVVHSDRNK